MYQHGFATLSLAEAYGAVDDSNLWPEGGNKARKQDIGAALELAVRAHRLLRKRKMNWAIGGTRLMQTMPTPR